VTGALVVARHALEEAFRRRVFAVVLVLTVAFLALYRLGAGKVFAEVGGVGIPEEVDDRTLAGATLLGLAMFGTLFLGAVLAVFLTLGAVRGDAERGLLQPLVVRPLGRPWFLAGRFLAAGVVSGVYVFVVYAAAALLTREAGGWWPDAFLAPGLELAGAALILVAISLLGSVVLSPTANGIAVFMVYGAGLVAGLMGQIGVALRSETLTSVARTTSKVLPFEALYQDALHRITEDTGGVEQFVLELGPFGGSQAASGGLLLWAAAYVALIFLATVALFARRDL
jgi:ABC-type transport system involved in multi-copper enzyme maturation permease subunit